MVEWVTVEWVVAGIRLAPVPTAQATTAELFRLSTRFPNQGD